MCKCICKTFKLENSHDYSVSSTGISASSCELSEDWRGKVGGWEGRMWRVPEMRGEGIEGKGI